ncbi:cathelicidin-related antimicrobial peptide Bf-CRAMP-like [Hyperolius riggenbachi]|uniref:cathelicidin-related antimicrobial peptide Bf-CRAMP-like n=1 Tax=Hyperolius riggenbachi TaxID=752182 RepID=UPI0035A2C91C
MEHSAMLCLVLGAITIAASVHLPMEQWGDEDIAIMAQFSTDYYNRVSGDSAIYRILANSTKYFADENSQSHQLQFTIKQTLCQKPDDNMTEECDFKEDGVVKLCTANIFVEDNQDIVVVNCNNQHQEASEHTRVRRSGGSRGGWGRIIGRPGYGSSIARVDGIESTTGNSTVLI